MSRARSALFCLSLIAVAAACLICTQKLPAAPSQYAAAPLVRVTSNTAPQGIDADNGVTVSLDASSASVPVGGEFGYRATVSLKQPAGYVQARMRLMMPGGSLIYQKTFVTRSSEPTSIEFFFSREIGDIGLEPASYPYELTVQTQGQGGNASLTVPGRLLVYDAKARPQSVVAAARISAQPLLTPDGGFIGDPGRFTRARDEVTALCDYVLSEPGARLTLALSPVMLEEWRRVASGYRFESPEGTVQVTAEEAVPQAYAQALERIKAAVATGRLEILALGYSDPDLSALASAGLIEDVAEQYGSGSSAIFAAIETTPSIGTAPAGGSLPRDSLAPLTKDGLRYAFVSTRWMRLKTRQPRPGVYPVTDSRMSVFATDERVGRSLVTSGVASAVNSAFARHLEASSAPYPAMVTVGPGGATAQQFVAAIKALDAEPWAELRLAGEMVASVAPPAQSVRLVKRPADRRTPEGYWADTSRARSWSRALASATGPRSRESMLAHENSLIAEASAWAGINGDWRPAERGLSFARDAETAARKILERITVEAKPVTLAGTSGDVPISVTNRSGRPLKVTMLFSSSAGVRIPEGRRRTVTLRPTENLVEVPVRMKGTLEGELTVRVVAAGMQLTESTVKLRASYIDRLVMFGAIAIVLAGLLVFIITRVKAAERADAEPRL